MNARFKSPVQVGRAVGGSARGFTAVTCVAPHYASGSDKASCGASDRLAPLDSRSRHGGLAAGGGKKLREDQLDLRCMLWVTLPGAGHPVA